MGQGEHKLSDSIGLSLLKRHLKGVTQTEATFANHAEKVRASGQPKFDELLEALILLAAEHKDDKMLEAERSTTRATAAKRKNVCELCGKMGHTKDNCWSHPDSPEYKECEVCGRSGHTKEECWHNNSSENSWKNHAPSSEKGGGKGKFQRCEHCGRTNHASEDCWYKHELTNGRTSALGGSDPTPRPTAEMNSNPVCLGAMVEKFAKKHYGCAAHVCVADRCKVEEDWAVDPATTTSKCETSKTKKVRKRRAI